MICLTFQHYFQVAILASAGMSQGAPQTDSSLARILQEQRYDENDDHNDSDDNESTKKQ